MPIPSQPTFPPLPEINFSLTDTASTLNLECDWLNVVTKCECLTMANVATAGVAESFLHASHVKCT